MPNSFYLLAAVLVASSGSIRNCCKIFPSQISLYSVSEGSGRSLMRGKNCSSLKNVLIHSEGGKNMSCKEPS